MSLSFNPAMALGTFERAIATAFAIPIWESANGTSTEFMKSEKSDKWSNILSCTPGLGRAAMKNPISQSS